VNKDDKKPKRVLYIFGCDALTNFVRGESFRYEYIANGFEVRYERLYSRALTRWEQRRRVGRLSTRYFGYLHAVFKRWKERRVLGIARGFDAVVLMKYVSSRLARQLRATTRARILYDFDDAVWLDSFLGRNAFAEILSTVHSVSCDNSYLLARARPFNPHVFVLPGPAQVEEFDKPGPRTGSAPGERAGIRLGWVGSSSTVPYLFAIFDAIEELGNMFTGVRLTILGGTRDFAAFLGFTNVSVEFVPRYSQAEMIKTIQGLTIGLYPLYRDELSRGRGFLKASLYMSGRCPVIASDNGGPIQELIRDGENGFLAKSTEEWTEKMRWIIEHPAETRTITDNGYRTVIANFSRKACFEKLSHNFLLGTGDPSA
jgi:glycosyltransferase involved in cell wall biosynthesis